MCCDISKFWKYNRITLSTLKYKWALYKQDLYFQLFQSVPRITWAVTFCLSKPDFEAAFHFKGNYFISLPQHFKKKRCSCRYTFFPKMTLNAVFDEIYPIKLLFLKVVFLRNESCHSKWILQPIVLSIFLYHLLGDFSKMYPLVLM